MFLKCEQYLHLSQVVWKYSASSHGWDHKINEIFRYVKHCLKLVMVMVHVHIHVSTYHIIINTHTQSLTRTTVRRVVSLYVKLPIPNSLGMLVALSPLASLLSMHNLFSNDRTTFLRFLHVEAAIFTAVKAYLQRTWWIT